MQRNEFFFFFYVVDFYVGLHRGDQVQPGHPESGSEVSFLTGDQRFRPRLHSKEGNRQKPNQKPKQKPDVLTSLLSKHLMGGKDFNPNPNVSRTERQWLQFFCVLGFFFTYLSVQFVL